MFKICVPPNTGFESGLAAMSTGESKDSEQK